jgi:hypothetical protein
MNPEVYCMNMASVTTGSMLLGGEPLLTKGSDF